MDYLIASLGWYIAGAFLIGFVVSWILCARVDG